MALGPMDKISFMFLPNYAYVKHVTHGMGPILAPGVKFEQIC